MLSKLDKEIVRLISRDIPLTKRPFSSLADRLGMEERDLLNKIKSFKKKGLMRKFTAVLNHKKAGFKYNAMVVWNIPGKLINKAGNTMASFEEVSHCYSREKAPDWDYNLYSMVHGRSKGECFKVIKKIYKKLGLRVNHKALFSSGEEKKTSVKF